MIDLSIFIQNVLQKFKGSVCEACNVRCMDRLPDTP